MQALKKVEVFDGTTDVERWIGRFELAVQLDEAGHKEAIYLAMRLSGAAFDMYQGLSPDKQADSSAIKAALRNTFGLTRSHAWRMALERRVRHGEVLDVVGEELKKYVAIATAGDNPRDRVVSLLFQDSLPTAVKEKILIHVGQDASYSEMLSCAKSVWQTTVPDNHELFAVKTLKRNERKCFRCGSSDHFVRDCRSKCAICGRQGHNETSCFKRNSSGNGQGES